MPCRARPNDLRSFRIKLARRFPPEQFLRRRSRRKVRRPPRSKRASLESGSVGFDARSRPHTQPDRILHRRRRTTSRSLRLRPKGRTSTWFGGRGRSLPTDCSRIRSETQDLVLGFLRTASFRLLTALGHSGVPTSSGRKALRPSHPPLMAVITVISAPGGRRVSRFARSPST